MTQETVLQQLVDMSLSLARPERDLVILGEGNTSAAVGDGTFWVKASGMQLPQAEPSAFVQLYLDKTCAVADMTDMTDDGFKAAMDDAKVDPSDTRRPSTETVLHAVALHEFGARFVGHTHPIAVNAIMCSAAWREALKGRLYPEEIVVCGIAPAFVPYADPGFELAVVTRQVLRDYVAEYGVRPRVVVMQNHGLIALGSTAQEVDNITAMFIKTCRIIAGTYVFGGPRFLSAANLNRIYTRPDEAYRENELGLSGR